MSNFKEKVRNSICRKVQCLFICFYFFWLSSKEIISFLSWKGRHWFASYKINMQNKYDTYTLCRCKLASFLHDNLFKKSWKTSELVYHRGSHLAFRACDCHFLKEDFFRDVEGLRNCQKAWDGELYQQNCSFFHMCGVLAAVAQHL